MTKKAKAPDRVQMVNTNKRNGAIGAVANVSADQVPAWEAKGWKLAKEAKENG